MAARAPQDVVRNPIPEMQKAAFRRPSNACNAIDDYIATRRPCM
jgi:hypothetical protein